MKTKSKRKHHIIALDPDPAILNYLCRILEDRYTVSLYTEAADLIQCLKDSPPPDLLLMDWHLDVDGAGENALDLLTRLRASRPSLPIIMLACSAELKEVVVATRMGATDVILKPFRKADIDLAVELCLKEAIRLPAGDDDEMKEIPLDENTSFVRACQRMREIESQCRLVARADIPVLILGESGTGKEVATLFIHKMSARSHRTFHEGQLRGHARRSAGE